MNARDIKDLMAMLSEATERQEALYIENEGEITSETEEMDAEIDAIKELLTTEGIDSLGSWLRAKEDEKKRYKAEKDYVTRKINATDKSIDYIKSLINQVMRETGVEKVKGELGYSFTAYTSDTTTVNKPNLFAKYEERLIDAMAKAGIPAYVTATLNASSSIAREVGLQEGDEAIFERHLTPTVKFGKPRASKSE